MTTTSAPSLAESVDVPLATVPRGASESVPFHFDREAFAAVLDRPYPHRQVVAPTSFVRATVGMAHFQNALNAYADPAGFAAGPDSLHCAAVLFGGYSYNMVLDDAMFAKYPIGLLCDREMRPNDTSARAFWKALRRNPMMETLNPLIASGVSFFVCNNALTSISVELARRTSANGAPVTRARIIDIHDELAAHFVPNTMLVPAGVAALIALQESRFTFLPE